MTIFEKLQLILSRQLGLNVIKMMPTTSIREDLGMEEMEMMEFKLAIELGFRVRIPSKILDTMNELGDFVNYIQQNINKNSDKK